MRLLKTNFLLLSLEVFIQATRITNPNRLDDISIESLKASIKDQSTVKILERICPYIFDKTKPLTTTGFYKVFDQINLTDSSLNKGMISVANVDLSNLSIERIPYCIASKITNLKVLNLSGNPNLKLNEKWFKVLIESNEIRELSLDYCNLSEENFATIAKMTSLERLSMSGNYKLNDQLNSLELVLKKLVYLDVSNCKLNSKCLKFIFENSKNLVSLNYSRNPLKVPFSTVNNINEELKKSLKSINLSFCSLKSYDLNELFIFENLNEIDLSGNSFSSPVLVDIQKPLELKVEKEKTLLDHSNPRFSDENSYNQNLKLHEKHFENLKILKLNDCEIASNDFITSLFNIDGIESLSLSGNSLCLSLERLRNCKAVETLKKLEMRECEIYFAKSLMNLASFKKLEYLDIAYNTFLDLNENFSIGELASSLTYLDISNCQWNLFGFRAIAECTRLECLKASFNYFTNVPAHLMLRNLKKTLKEVYLNGCGLNSNFFNSLTECECLEKLNFSGNNLSNVAANFTFRNLANTLTHLYLESCNLNQFMKNAISECSKLTQLNIREADLDLAGHFPDILLNF